MGNIISKRYAVAVVMKKKVSFTNLSAGFTKGGWNIYIYKPKEDHITKLGASDKVLYLSDEAMNTVIKTIAHFEDKAEQARKWKSVKVSFQDRLISIYYQKSEDGDFEYYSECSNSEKTVKKFYKHDDPLHWLLCDMSHFINKYPCKVICTPKVRHFWRCIFLWQKKEQYNKSIVQNSK